MTKESSEHLLVERQVLRRHRIAARLDLENRFRGDPARGHGEVRALAVDGVVELGGVADHDPAVAVELRDRLVAALGNEMRGIFLHLGSLDQRRHRRMLLEALEQAVGRLAGLLEVGHQAADAERHAFLVGIDEAHAGHAPRDGSGRLDHGAFVALEIEARLDGLARQEVHLLDRERDIFRLRDFAQVGTGAEQAVDALGEHDDVGMHLAVVAGRCTRRSPCRRHPAPVRSRWSRTAPVAPASRTLTENHLSNCARMMV